MTEFNWGATMARRARSMQPSPFVDLKPMMELEDLIFFGGGTPSPDLVPVDRLREASRDVWEEARDISFYGEPYGHAPLRELISARMSRRGLVAPPDRVLITNGSQQGLDLVARVLFDPGDRVIVEGPTYFGALQAFDAYEVEYVVAPMDEKGLIPDELEAILRSTGRVKAIYTVSIFQNPTGVTLSDDRRHRILDLAQQFGVAIIEDDPYGELVFDDSVTRPLAADDPNVVYLGTFSKTIMPALRIGWTVFQQAIAAPLLDGKEAVDIQSDRFVQRMIVGAAQGGWLDQHIESSRLAYFDRASAMFRALEREMPEGVSWTRPGGGFFTWVTLPDGLTGDYLLQHAANHRVGYLPGSFFYSDRRAVPALRLGFTTLPVCQIDEGIARLARAIRDATEAR